MVVGRRDYGTAGGIAQLVMQKESVCNFGIKAERLLDELVQSSPDVQMNNVVLCQLLPAVACWYREASSRRKVQAGGQI